MAKTTMIKLDCPVLEVKGQEFPITHAEELLKYQVFKGLDDWKLSPNQKFEFKNGALTPTSTGKN